MYCPHCAQRRSYLEAMDWSHSSITSFRETLWAKVQRTGRRGDAALLQFEKAFSLMCSPCLSCPPLSFCVLFCLFSPLPLVSAPLRYLLWFFSYPFSYCLFSPNCTHTISIFLPPVCAFLSQPCAAQQGSAWLQSTKHSCPALLAAFTDPAVHSVHSGYYTRETRWTKVADSRS